LNETLLWSLVVVCLLAGVVTALVFAWHAGKKRTEALAELADKLHLTFHADGKDAPFIATWPSFQLFEQGRSKSISHVMHGQVKGIEATLFDYSYATGSGKSTTTHRQTVVCLRASDLSLPNFALRPETFFHTVGKLFGHQDINFDTHPRFSRKYLLRGQDELAIRGVFGAQLLDYFEGTEGLAVEGSADRLLFYRPSRCAEPDEIRALLADALQVLARFSSMRSTEP
jgi:hypothetical protein